MSSRQRFNGDAEQLTKTHRPFVAANRSAVRYSEAAVHDAPVDSKRILEHQDALGALRQLDDTFKFKRTMHRECLDKLAEEPPQVEQKTWMAISSLIGLRR